MASNPYVNKVQLADGTTVIDITDTTAVASDVKTGKYFYNAAGQRIEGTASGGSGAVSIVDTLDANGGTIRTITAVDLDDISRSSANLTANGATVTAPAGYYAADATKTIASGTEGTPTASKGTVSNHSVTVTPSVTNTAGYIAGGTKTGNGVVVTVSELESGTKQITENGLGISVSGYAAIDVAVPTSSGMNKQAYFGNWNTNSATYVASDLTITVSKTGTYKVSWTGFRNTTSGTSGSQLYRTRGGTETAIGNANTTFNLTNYGQRVELTGQSFEAGDVLTVYARARNTSYAMYVANLIIEQTA